MNRDISIHAVTQDILRAELLHLISYFRELGHEQCEVVFGWHWGMDYPLKAPWETLHFPLAELEAEVRKPEDAGLGEFGRDDVTIRFPLLDAEFCFCHHGGIRLKFSPPSQVAEDFLKRWTLAGLSPRDREYTPEELANQPIKKS